MISQDMISDEHFNSISIEAQCVFIRMLCVSDDCGVVPANTYKLNVLINTPQKIAKRLQALVDEIVSAGLGNRFEYDGEEFFAFKKRSFEDYQSYILKKATKSEYMRLPKRDFDAMQGDIESTTSANIPIAVRRHFAVLLGLPIDSTTKSVEAKCAECGAIGKIRNNGHGWITLDDLNFDHIVPHRFGGGNTPDNFQILCPSCNQKKKFADIEKYGGVLENSRNSGIVIHNDESAVSTVESRKQKVESKEQKAKSIVAKEDVAFDGRHFQWKNESYQKFKKMFFEKDFENEVTKMERWLNLNPDKQKQNYVRFIGNWMNNAQVKHQYPNEMPSRERDQYRKSEPKILDLSKPYNPNL